MHGREISVSCKTFERSVILTSGDTFWIEKAWLASPEPAPQELPDTLQNQAREIIERALDSEFPARRWSGKSSS
jgi:hypothetical protein